MTEEKDNSLPSIQEKGKLTQYPLLNPDRDNYLNMSNDELSMETAEKLRDKGWGNHTTEIQNALTNDSSGFNHRLTYHNDSNLGWVDKNLRPVELTDAEHAELENRMPQAPRRVRENVVSRYLVLRYALTQQNSQLNERYDEILPFMVDAAFLRETWAEAGHYHIREYDEQWRTSTNRLTAIDIGHRIARDFAEMVPSLEEVQDYIEIDQKPDMENPNNNSLLEKIRRSGKK